VTEVRLRDRLSLRARLSLVLVAVVAVALVIGNVAVYAFASNFLNQRVDEQLSGLTGFADGFGARTRFERGPGFPTPSSTLPGSPASPTGPTGGDQANLGANQANSPTATFRPRGAQELIAGVYFEFRQSDGTVANRGFVFTTANDQRTPPDLPSPLHLAPQESLVLESVAHDGDRTIPYRVLVRGQADGSMTITGLPTTDLAATRTRLVQIELVATVVVLALVAGLTWWLVGVGLAPLARMESTAEQIAEGDLSQRVDRAGPATEIGRLGAALNKMLTEIETAFAAKDTSEQKLRRFVADASHELRSPLTSIRGYAELLRRGTLTDADEVTSAGRRIELEATRLGALVDDLLLLARLDEGVDLVTSSVDISQIATDVVADARVTEPDRRITLETPHDGPVIVDGDKNRLTQVVTNLVANARVHTPSGTPIEVSVRRRPASGGRPIGSQGVALEVVDHGPGIDPETVASVFDRFYRTDESRSRDSGGAGLGLAIVAAILDAHGGRCEVAATPGGGATFRVLLERHRTPAADPPPVRRLAAAPAESLPEYVVE
jgi:two-component system OmpR family sensor kinase